MDLGHVLETGALLAHQLLVHVHDDVVVLGVDRRDAAGLGQYLQHLPDVAVLHHAALARRGDVGGEHLDAGVAGLHRLGDLRVDVGRELAQQHRVEGVVAIALAGPLLLPVLDRLLHIHAALDRCEVDRRRGAAEQRRLADPRRRLGQFRLAVRHRHRPVAMDMRVDAAGDDDLAGGVDDPPGAQRGEAPRPADRGDLLAGNPDIGRLRPRGQDGKPAGDDDVEHVSLL